MPVTEKFVLENSKIFERHMCGFKIGDYLGSGCWGSAFNTINISKFEWVAKITKDVEEAKAAQALISLRGEGHQAFLFPGLVDILTVNKVVDLKDDGEDLYVIVREEVTPLEDSDISHEIINELDNCLYIIEEKHAYTKDEVSQALIVLDNHAPYLARSIKELWFCGHTPIDLDTVNVGISDRARLGAPNKTIVMFDISFEENTNG